MRDAGVMEYGPYPPSSKYKKQDFTRTAANFYRIGIKKNTFTKG